MGEIRFLPILTSIIQYGRRDVHAEAYRAGREWKYKPVPKPLSDEDLKHHLEAGPYFGIYLMKDGSNKTQLAVLDFDSHNEEISWDEMRGIVLRVFQTARQFGLHGFPARSGGGHGIHLFFKWDKLQIASHVRRLLTKVLAAEGFKDGAGGVAQGEIEIFPKQDRVPENGYGNLIAAPFARESVPLRDDMSIAEEPIALASSRDVVSEEESEEEQEQVVGEANVDTVADALKYIENKALSYEEWITVGLALKSALGDKGRALFINWSLQYAGNTREIIEQKWRSFQPTKVTVKKIYYLARKSGWPGIPHDAPPFSEIWLAIKFIDSFGGGLRYTSDIGRWNCWSGVHWEEDHTLIVQNMAKEWCRKMAMDAKKKRTSLASNKTVNAIVSLARPDDRVSVKPEVWDRNPWLLATPEGTVDLREGTQRKSDPGDYATKLCSVAPGGDCFLWMDTLNKICAGDDKRIKYLQRLAGYFLTGVTREEKIFFLYGSGRNGKGTFIETIGQILGDYSTTVAMSTLTMEKHPEHPTEIAKLRGIRLAMGSETRDGARWNIARLKMLTGGDALTARFMRGDFFDFMPTHKIVVSSNNKPALGTVNVAIEHRIELIPFDITFDQPDKLRKERLRAEMPGIFAWAIEGCLAWQRYGIATPDDVIHATEEYLKNQDDMQIFIDDRCTHESAIKTPIPDLYATFVKWCEQSNAYVISKKSFTQRLELLGYQIERGHGNVAYVFDLRAIIDPPIKSILKSTV